MATAKIGYEAEKRFWAASRTSSGFVADGYVFHYIADNRKRELEEDGYDFLCNVATPKDEEIKEARVEVKASSKGHIILSKNEFKCAQKHPKAYFVVTFRHSKESRKSSEFNDVIVSSNISSSATKTVEYMVKSQRTPSHPPRSASPVALRPEPASASR